MVEDCQVNSREKKHGPPISNKGRGNGLYKCTLLETSINIPSSWSLLERLSPPLLGKGWFCMPATGSAHADWVKDGYFTQYMVAK